MEQVSLPWRSDASTGFWAVLIMTIAGAGGWYLFTRGLVESRWFLGHGVPPSVFGYFAAVLFGAGMGTQLLMEWKGGRFVWLAAILIGVVPVLVGSVLVVINEEMMPIAAWIIGISPASLPFYAPGSLLSLAELPPEAARAVPRALLFWLVVSCFTALWMMVKVLAARKAMGRKVMES